MGTPISQPVASIALTNNHGVGETPEQQALDSVSPGNTGYGCQRGPFMSRIRTNTRHLMIRIA